LCAEMERSEPGCVAELRYEDLVEDPLGQISRIYSRLNLGDLRRHAHDWNNT